MQLGLERLAHVHQRIHMCVGVAGMADVMRAADYIAAQRRRSALARLVASDAKVWLLDEPLNALSVTPDGFARAGAAIGAFPGPVAIVQEGGYNLAALGPCVAEVLRPFC